MKTYLISYVYRGSNYRFMSPYQIKVTANNKKEARENAIYQLGDIYKIKSVTEI